MTRGSGPTADMTQLVDLRTPPLDQRPLGRAAYVQGHVLAGAGTSATG